MIQYLVGVFVSDEALELVIESETLDVELAHHLIAVDGFGELEFVHSLLLIGHDLGRKIDLSLHLFVFSLCIHADVVLQILQVLLKFLSLQVTALRRLLA